MTLFIHRKNDDFDNVANFQYFTGVAQSTVAYFGNVYQTILVNTNVHKDAEIDDISDGTGQLHAGNQIFHFQHILAQNGLGQFIAGIAAGFA